MGRTKALVEVGGTPMAARVAAVLRTVGCSEVVLYGGDPAELAVLGVPVLADRYPGSGPLAGVLGALEEFAEQTSYAEASALIVACDLAYLTAQALAPMLAAADRHPDADVLVARTASMEPACAIWRVAAAPRVRVAFDRGERALHRVIGDLDHREIAVDADALRNINTPDDIRSVP